MVTLEKVTELLLHGENIHVEYKRSKDSLSRDLFETICAFLNREGGYLLLGINNDGSVEGISDCSIDDQVKTLVRDTNNAQILFPTYYFAPQILEVEEEKRIIVLYIP